LLVPGLVSRPAGVEVSLEIDAQQVSASAACAGRCSARIASDRLATALEAGARTTLR